MAAAWPAPRTPCEAAANWVEAHREALPQTLTAMRTIPATYRRAAFNAMSPSVRREMWRNHLATFLSSQSGLTLRQRDVIRLMMLRLDTYITDDRTGREGRLALRKDKVDSVMNAEFIPELARVIFSGNGLFSDDGRGAIASIGRPAYSGAAATPTTNATRRDWVCDCNSDVGGEGNCPHDCVGEWCNYSTFGCGWFGLLPCDAKCYIGRSSRGSE
jgi:hypothetical protein